MDPTQDKKSVCIIGGGIMGLTTAYFLGWTHNVTLIEPNTRVGGASEKNAGTLCIALPPWNTKNYTQTIKDNLNLLKGITYGIDTMFCLVRPSLIFDSDFGYWVWLYLKSGGPESVYDSTKGLADLFFVSFGKFDEIGKEITDGNPKLVDLHDDKFVEIITTPN